MKTLRRWLVLSTVAVACLGWTGQPASANTYSINIGNTDIAGYPGAYGTVTVTRTSSTTAEIHFKGASSGGFYYSFGDGRSIDLNFNTTSTTTYAFVKGTQLNTAIDAGVASDLSPTNPIQNADGFGQFNFELDTNTSAGGAANSWTDLIFTVTSTGANWGTDDDVLTPNTPGGYLLAAHVFVRTSEGAQSAIQTGYASTSGAVPEIDPTNVSSAFALLAGACLVVSSKLRHKVSR